MQPELRTLNHKQGNGHADSPRLDREEDLRSRGHCLRDYIHNSSDIYLLTSMAADKHVIHVLVHNIQVLFRQKQKLGVHFNGQEGC